MMESDEYVSISNPSEGTFRDKGSRFLGFAFPVNDERMAKGNLENLRKEHHSARHHCFGQRILSGENITDKSSDDGEPAGTAGFPILNEIRSAGLLNIQVVVVRYFGGILLGKSGLNHAYRTATRESIAQAQKIHKTIDENFRIRFSYEDLDSAIRMLKKEKATISSVDKSEICELIFSIRKGRAKALREQLNRISSMSFQS